jgi:hypothetical protein
MREKSHQNNPGPDSNGISPEYEAGVPYDTLLTPGEISLSENWLLNKC